MRKYLAALLLLCGLAASAVAFPHGSGTTPINASASATTIFAAWNTPTAQTTTLSCGTVLGTYNIPAVNNGSQTGVNNHTAIVSGLVASTTYFCQATAGTSINFTLATNSTPSSTPILTVTLGTATVASNGQNAGDTYYNATGSNGITYLATDDTPHGWNSGSNPSSNMMMGDLISTTPFTGANVNRLSNYGSWATCNGDDSRSPKISGMFAYNNVLYAAMGRQYNPNCPGYPSGTTTGIYPQTAGAIIKSADNGVSWSNFQTPTTYDVNGSVTTPASATMFASSTRCASASFVMYGADNGTVLPAYRVDNADAYAYITCGTNWDNGDALYMARIPLSSLAALDSSKIQYFTGGDGSLDANWSSSDASISAILSNTGKLGYTDVQYMPSIGRYVMMEWYYPTLNSFSTTNWIIYEAQHPWGPWTLVNGPTAMSPSGFYNPVVYNPSAITATANGNPMTLLVAGDFTNGTYYQLYTMSMTLNTH